MFLCVNFACNLNAHYIKYGDIRDFVSLREEKKTESQDPRDGLLNLRVTSDTLNALLTEAHDENTTLNSITDRILRKHLQFDIPSEKIGVVSLRKEWYRNLLESADENKFIEKTRRDTEQLREFLMVKYAQGDLRAYCESIKSMGNYSKLWSTAYEVDGSKYRLALHHDFGRKHSVLVGSSVLSALSAIGIEGATSRLTDSTVVIEFDSSSMPSKWQ